MELTRKHAMSSCGRYFVVAFLSFVVVEFLISFINWVSIRVHWKKSLIYTLFYSVRNAFESQNSKAVAAKRERPRQTGLQIEFTSWIYDNSLSFLPKHRDGIFFVKNIIYLLKLLKFDWQRFDSSKIVWSIS